MAKDEKPAALGFPTQVLLKRGIHFKPIKIRPEAWEDFPRFYYEVLPELTDATIDEASDLAKVATVKAKSTKNTWDQAAFERHIVREQIVGFNLPVFDGEKNIEVGYSHANLEAEVLNNPAARSFIYQTVSAMRGANDTRLLETHDANGATFQP